MSVSRIREHHEASDSVIGAPRTHEVPTGERETASGERPAHVQLDLERGVMVTEPNTTWVTDITCIHATERWLHLCVVIDLAGRKVVGWATSTPQDRHWALRAVLMAAFQGPHRKPVILPSDRATEFASYAHQQFLRGCQITLSISADCGRCPSRCLR